MCLYISDYYVLKCNLHGPLYLYCEIVIRFVIIFVYSYICDYYVLKCNLYLICMVRWSRMSIELVEMTNRIGTNCKQGLKIQIQR